MCNHPELFERREAKSPYFFQPEAFVLPKFIYRRGLLREAFPSRRHLLTGRFYIWHPEYIHHSLFPAEAEPKATSNCFASFSRLVGLSPDELFRLMNDGLLARLHNVRKVMDDNHILHHTHLWHQPVRWQLFHLDLKCVRSCPRCLLNSIMMAVLSGFHHIDFVL